MSSFARPVDLSFPQVYGTFQALNKAGDGVIEYQIRDLPEELFEKSLEILAADFATEETVCVAKNLTANPAALNEVCYIWYETMRDGLSLGCFANDGSDELAGVAVMKVLMREKNPIDEMQPNEDDTKDLLKLLDFMQQQYKICEKYNVDKYLTDYAVCTRKEFRSRGVATEFIKARTPMMKLLSIQVTSSSYTVIGTQKAAAKAGHYDGYTILYEELQAKFPSFDFSKRNVDVYKVMDFKI